MTKVAETNEIFVTAAVLNAFLTRGIYNLSYSDVVTAAAGALGTLKEETFRRWLRNPLWRYNEFNGVYVFRFGMKPKMIGSPASDFGLELVLSELGTGEHVRWMRIWTSNFTNGEKANATEREQVVSDIHAFVKSCRLRWAKTGDRPALLTELSTEFVNEIMPKCCAYRGCQGIMQRPMVYGKKTLVYIPRNRIVPAAEKRVADFMKFYNDIEYIVE